MWEGRAKGTASHRGPRVLSRALAETQVLGNASYRALPTRVPKKVEQTGLPWQEFKVVARCPQRQKLGIQRPGPGPGSAPHSPAEPSPLRGWWVRAGQSHLVVEDVVRLALARQPPRGISFPFAHLHFPCKEAAVFARCRREVPGHPLRAGLLWSSPSASPRPPATVAAHVALPSGALSFTPTYRCGG